MSINAQCSTYLLVYSATTTTTITTLSLHDALPIWMTYTELNCVGTKTIPISSAWRSSATPTLWTYLVWERRRDRKSTRLNSSHRCISYAVFCLKKKTTISINTRISLLTIQVL